MGQLAQGHMCSGREGLLRLCIRSGQVRSDGGRGESGAASRSGVACDGHSTILWGRDLQLDIVAGVLVRLDVARACIQWWYRQCTAVMH